MSIAEPRARWRDVFVGLAVGEVLATVLLLLPLFGLSVLRLAPLSNPPDTGFLEWPFRFDGSWSVAADLTLIGLLAWAGAFVVSRVVAGYSGRPVSRRRTALILFCAGGAPFAWAHGVVPGPLFGFVAAAAAIRAWAVGRIDRPVARRTVALGAAVIVALVCTAGSYALLHPLRVIGSGSSDTGPLLVLGSNSPFPVEIVRVEARLPGGVPPSLAFSPVAVRVAPRSTSVAVLPVAPCPDGVVAAFDVREVTVSFRVLGRIEREVLRLAPPYHAHCP